MEWPQGPVPFDVAGIVHLGRRCISATNQENPALVKAAHEVVGTLTEYVDGLPPEIQVETARRLVAALHERLAYKSQVQPKKTQRGNT